MGFPKNLRNTISVIAIPTTTSTGSEIIYNAVFIDKISNIKFGIIGCGNIGSRHARHISENKEGVLKSVLDIDVEKSRTKIWSSCTKNKGK